MIPTGDFTVVTLEEYEEDGEDEENGEDEKVEEEGAEIVKEVKRNDSLWRCFTIQGGQHGRYYRPIIDHL